MTNLKIPPDLYEFLSEGAALEYDVHRCEVGAVSTKALNELDLAAFPVDVQGTRLAAQDPQQGKLGCYLVPCVDLLRPGEGEEALGILVWIPSEGRYATWDSSHCLLYGFSADVSWGQIAADPLRYLNAQWEDDEEQYAELVCPFEHPYSTQQRFEALRLQKVEAVKM